MKDKLAFWPVQKKKHNKTKISKIKNKLFHLFT